MTTNSANSSISVILPNYNHGRYLRRAVLGLLDQDLPPSEIILIDDGSTDGSMTVIKELAAHSPLIRVFYNEKNIGLVATQNRALSLSTGSFLYLAAADDCTFPGFFSRALDMLKRHPTAGLFCGEVVQFDGLDDSLLGLRPVVMPSFTAKYLDPDQVRRLLRHSDNWILTGASVIRKDRLVAAGGLQEELGSFADGYLTRRIALATGFCFAPQIVAEWNVFPSSASMRTATDPQRTVALMELAARQISNDPLFPDWYAARFRDRWRFAASRLALSGKRVGVEVIRAFTPDGSPERRLLDITTRASGRWWRLLTTAALWLHLRPYRLIDLATTILLRKLTYRRALRPILRKE